MRRCATIKLEGIVQGVGFRPFIHRLANEFELAGWVKNLSTGIIIEVEGEEEKIKNFYKKVLYSPPPLATIIKKEIIFKAPVGLNFFKIEKSEIIKDEFTGVAADIATCSDCLDELFDKTNRRYKYPFINCTNCGPRFTIIKNIPYDRKNTTMDVFKMCKDCAKEYEDIKNRRYHAQPNACFTCGPKAWLEPTKPIQANFLLNAPIEEAARFIKEGYIVAIKGIGGFHLACDAENDAAVSRLRANKRHENLKPFAIMSKSISKIKKYCHVSLEEEQLLSSLRRPIVLLKKKESSTISKHVSPNNNYLGVMLPYTPIHYLLLEREDLLAVVMTSANVADEPLIKDNQEAKLRLFNLADYILFHNRDIYTRCDDSVSQIIDNKEVIIRRSRGYAPLPICLNFQLKEVLGVGAELKNTFCLAGKNLAFLSQHIGDLKNFETLNFFKEALSCYLDLFAISPKIVAYDMHPDYLSTNFAQEFAQTNPQIKLIPVQHHHAHIVSCMAENNLLPNDEVIGIAMDGIGYGEDGNLWGCEFMLVNFKEFKRVAHLKYMPMPGGDKATSQPYRMAISYLYSIYGEKLPDVFLKRWGEEKVLSIIKLIQSGINTPKVSSCGRLFDAVSSILGIRDVINYEAQAAVELEMLADNNYSTEDAYSYVIYEEEEMLIIDVSSAIVEIVSDLEKKKDLAFISTKFHNMVVNFIYKLAKIIKEKYNKTKVVLSGGTFQNRYLLKRVKDKLSEEFSVIMHSKVPPNDGGISLGQAVIASFKE